MSEDTPLTALCAVCHVGALKYTCPRCGIHTCSLACVKLHKARASCSGVRDPTAYRRRADLATASSVDADFNFITSLERSLATPDADAGDSNIQAAGLAKARLTDSARLERLVRERGVTWRRAPRGMRRRQENETRVEHSSVTWTVELMLPAGGGRKLCAVPDTSTVGEALLHAVRPPRPPPPPSSPSKQLGKRKRGPGRPAGQEEDHGSRDKDAFEGDEKTQQRRASPPRGSAPEVSDANTSTGAAPINLSQIPSTSAVEPRPNHPYPPTQQQQQPPPPSPYADHHVYLLRPNTPAKLKVLAPLRRDATLRDALHGRTVLEFPTLYVKTEPPAALVAPFMAEDTYLLEHGEDVVIVPRGPPPDAGGAVGEAGREEHEQGEEGEITEGVSGESTRDLKRDADEVLRALADPGQVLSVLEQDLT